MSKLPLRRSWQFCDSMMKTDAIGLYVHIPFCLKKCAYCDFTSFPVCDFSRREQYIDELCKEIASYRSHNATIDTVFFGGGTPSLLSGSEFSKISDTISNSFKIATNVEFTMEANPGTISRDNLSGYIECGVNRLSIGLQSIHENELKNLGRIHDYGDFLKSYTIARELGLTNINVDLMYGIPDQTIESFCTTLSNVISLNPDHLSVYGLILEPGTPLHQRVDRLVLPNEDEEVDMYYHAAEFLLGAGYEHYEISNYSKAQKRCAHNLKYWHLNEYIGVGLSAHSFYRGKRYYNSSALNEYFSPIGKGYMCNPNEEFDQAFEYVMLGLRTADGISLGEYEKQFGRNLVDGRAEMLAKLSDLGLITMRNDRLSLTERGFYVSNTILSELI